MATAAQWLAGARPRTLPVVVGPVLIGTAAAFAGRWGPVDGGLFSSSSPPWGWVQVGRALLALVVGLALQVGVNYANDYSDGIRGTDDDRVGPFRLTGSHAAPAGQVRHAAFAAFGVAALAGSALVIWSGRWWLLAVGGLCVLAAWYYTGGRRPYGYAALGEVSVIVFFRLVATRGTAAAIGDAGIPVRAVNKVKDGRPHIVDLLKNGEIQLVFTTVDETRTAIADSRHIRQAALAHRVTYYTSMAGCEAAVEGMKHRDDLGVASLQELHAELH